MDIYLAIYFLAGLVQDVIFTLNIRFVTKEKIGWAVITSFAVTMVSMTALYTILTNLDSQRSLPAIVAYASGISCGTFLGMKFRLESKN